MCINVIVVTEKSLHIILYMQDKPGGTQHLRASLGISSNIQEYHIVTNMSHFWHSKPLPKPVHYYVTGLLLHNTHV